MSQNVIGYYPQQGIPKWIAVFAYDDDNKQLHYSYNDEHPIDHYPFPKWIVAVFKIKQRGVPTA
jgi:hypothetical protein